VPTQRIQTYETVNVPQKVQHQKDMSEKQRIKF